MTTIFLGMGLLLLTLAGFSLFSMKAPKGSAAMSGLANAAVATFLVEAVHRYISGDLLGSAFLGEVGSVSGSLGGVASAILIPISMGANPLFAVVAGVAVGGYSILPGFVVGYLIGFIAPVIEKHLPAGLDTILGALLLAPIARGIAFLTDPVVNAAMGYIGNTITAATDQSPVLMGFLLGGIIKMICTSPLSSMALTAMLGLTGLPMDRSYRLLRRFLYQRNHLRPVKAGKTKQYRGCYAGALNPGPHHYAPPHSHLRIELLRRRSGWHRSGFARHRKQRAWNGVPYSRTVSSVCL